MKLLLDTHTLVWWLSDDDQLSDRARDCVSDPQNQIFVSAASAYEVSLKHSMGRFPEAQVLSRNWANIIHSAGFDLIDISSAHGLRAGLLPRHHGDPFDRLLIATAVEETMSLVSKDHAIAQYDVPMIW